MEQLQSATERRLGNEYRRSRLAMHVAGALALGLTLNGAVHQEAQSDEQQIAVATSNQMIDEQTHAAAYEMAQATTLEPKKEQWEKKTAQPNIIFFLADDMDYSLLKHMPNTRKYIFRQGATFENFYTNIGLCCPSRASILSGKYAHNTGVIGNLFPDGFWGFHTGDEKKRTFAVRLKESGYHTALLGKYFNGYGYGYPFEGNVPARDALKKTFVPNGWSDWAVPIEGQYFGIDYILNSNGELQHRTGPDNYLGDVTARHMVQMIEENKDDKGLMIEYSSYGPHNPQPASPQEKNNEELTGWLESIKYPRTPDFNERDVSDKPKKIQKLDRLTSAEIREIDETYRQQILSVKSLDRYVGMAAKALKRTGQLDDTYLVFASDNGYHMGTHRKPPGKNSAYESDIHLPFAMRGPGIEPGTQVKEIVSNIDIAPTFADMANVALRYTVDGESLLPLAQEKPVNDWRKYVFIQRGAVHGYAKPGELGEPGEPGQARYERARFIGAVSGRYTFVKNRGDMDELYDNQQDPYQLHNLLSIPRNERSDRVRLVHAEMREALRDLKNCRGTNDCRVK